MAEYDIRSMIKAKRRPGVFTKATRLNDGSVQTDIEEWADYTDKRKQADDAVENARAARERPYHTKEQEDQAIGTAANEEKKKVGAAAAAHDKLMGRKTTGVYWDQEDEADLMDGAKTGNYHTGEVRPWRMSGAPSDLPGVSYGSREKDLDEENASGTGSDSKSKTKLWPPTNNQLTKEYPPGVVESLTQGKDKFNIDDALSKLPKMKINGKKRSSRPSKAKKSVSDPTLDAISMMRYGHPFYKSDDEEVDDMDQPQDQDQNQQPGQPPQPKKRPGCEEC